MMRHLYVATLCLIAAFAPCVGAQEIGPAHGALVIVGGGRLDSTITIRFLELAGGRDAPIVVIPTANGDGDYGPYWAGLSGFKAVGATNLTVLHTTDRTVANTDAFVEPIRKAQGVWFVGGRQWRLADAYLHTKVQDELNALLDRGGVIGGSSAGATIQGSFLVRGDTRTNTIMMGDHQEGMGFLKESAIDQHVLRRNRQFDLIPVIEAHPDLLGIGIDENTAIVVQGDRFRVMGAGYVLIYDHQHQLDSGGRFYFLAPGDRFDLKTRTAERPSQDWTPLDRVQAKPWGRN
jgi:cyanophycinase